MNDEGAGAFLARLTAKLAAAGVPHMVVGSFASSFHGVPRSSQDLDLVIDPQAESEDYYADADAAFDALRRRGQFNVIDMATAWKADLIMRKSRPFSVEEMRRRVVGDLLGAQVFVASRVSSPESVLSARMVKPSALITCVDVRDPVEMLSMRGSCDVRV